MNGEGKQQDYQIPAADFSWRKMKNADIPLTENFLVNIEKDYVSACGRFLLRQSKAGNIIRGTKDPVWLLRKKNNEIMALIINSGSTVIPVLRGIREIPELKFLKGFLRLKKIHSLQGLKNEVVILEEEIKKTGWKSADIIDYDLMSLDKPPEKKGFSSGPPNLILRVPAMIDLDAIAPLQAAYEKEEVLPKGSVFSPAASRINTAQIIANGKVLAAQLNGRFIGKINVSAVSFTRYQVGGVYVHPHFRGQGVARRMAFEFISSLIGEGRGVTLFVKKTNTAARSLYSGLGFSVRGDYRITYY
ncbi:MAG: GNAT family N-acetyltransferase [Treponema sp.]|jgi:ribosomal protein S18 acetylase RimI-like enzyme|nr:GNAT family N-acetyltransferase [Treponema sp.]